MTLGRRIVWGLLTSAAALGTIRPPMAQAGAVASYTTSGSFVSSSSSTITLSTGGSSPSTAVQITFGGASETNLAVPNSSAPFGTFTATVVAAGSANLSPSDTFNLLLTQTDPSNGSHTFSANVTGTVKLGTSNDVTFSFNSPLDTTLGTITYTIPSSVLLASPSKTVGATSTANLTANITTASIPAVPEPSTLMGAATALPLGLSLAWRRRRRTAA